MFWGLSIEGGKHYSQIVNETFNVTMAALETREFSGVDSKPTGLAQVMVRHDRTEFLLCSLQHGHLNQQPLNLCFSEGEEVTFFMEGKGMVHLSGYLRPSFNMDDGDMDYPSMSESDSEESLGNTSDENEGSITLQELAKAKTLLESDSEDDEETDWMPSGKRKKKNKLSKSIKPIEGPKRKKPKRIEDVLEDDYDEEEDEDYEYEGSEEDEDDEDDDMESEFISYEAEEASEDEESEEEEGLEKEVQLKKGKQKKKDKNKKKESNKSEPVETPKSDTKLKRKKNKLETSDNKENIERQSSMENNKTTPKQGKQTPKSEKKTPKNKSKSDDSSPEIKSIKKEKTTPKKLKGGTTILDLKEGSGQVAKAGKKILVYYRGIVASSQKQFDSCVSGAGFPFRLGRGEVIKGWDLGVEGMKVGGKRKITIPPHQGYGNKRAGVIPPNSTLIFEVELKNVK